ncbi:hypothetical protein HNO89_002940 [Sporosarcina luteola]|nr:hypothetical protein [Sporosarcina luteola]
MKFVVLNRQAFFISADRWKLGSRCSKAMELTAIWSASVD